MAEMTRTAARMKKLLITVPNTNIAMTVDINMAPEMMNNLVKLLPCFIITDIIKPLNA